jgi:hypothetical protein
MQFLLFFPEMMFTLNNAISFQKSCSHPIVQFINISTELEMQQNVYSARNSSSAKKVHPRDCGPI